MSFTNDIRRMVLHGPSHVWVRGLWDLTTDQMRRVVAELCTGVEPFYGHRPDVHSWACRHLLRLSPEREWVDESSAPVRSVERLVYHDEPGRHCCEWETGDAK